LAYSNNSVDVRLLESLVSMKAIHLKGRTQLQKWSMSLSKFRNDLKIPEGERAHRIGKPSNQYSRQIIVRLNSPGIKHRILKTAKNLKDLPSYSHDRLIEDLTAMRSKL